MTTLIIKQSTLLKDKFELLEQIRKRCSVIAKKEVSPVEFENAAWSLLKWAVETVENGQRVAAVDDTNGKYHLLVLEALFFEKP